MLPLLLSRITKNLNPSKQFTSLTETDEITFETQLFFGRIVNRHVAYGLHHL